MWQSHIWLVEGDEEKTGEGEERGKKAGEEEKDEEEKSVGKKKQKRWTLEKKGRRKEKEGRRGTKTEGRKGKEGEEGEREAEQWGHSGFNLGWQKLPQVWHGEVKGNKITRNIHIRS